MLYKDFKKTKQESNTLELFSRCGEFNLKELVNIWLSQIWKVLVIIFQNTFLELL